MITFRRSLILIIPVAVFILAGFQFQSSAQKPPKPPTRTIRRDEPPVDNEWTSELRPIIEYYVADRACWSNPVRWLLADDVGLGKTVEACLILNRLARTGRAENRRG